MVYKVVTVFNIPSRNDAEEMQQLAFSQYGCLGVEEYSLTEEEVDSILGQRSYSGGDLPDEVLMEVDQRVLGQNFHQKFFFDSNKSIEFYSHVKNIVLCEVEHEELKDTDWNSEWKKHYKPIVVTDTFSILPEWENDSGMPRSNFIKIHPGMGFGTGSHETTFLCLKSFLELENSFSQNSEFLDYGSGSGILGLSALIRLPGTTCDMVDIDLEAHQNCLQNIELNNLDPKRVSLFYLKNRPTKKFDLVFANILQNILHEEVTHLVERVKKDKFLILSGLLSYQVQDTTDLYLKTNVCQLVKSEIKGDWGVIVLRKSV